MIPLSLPKPKSYTESSDTNIRLAKSLKSVLSPINTHFNRFYDNTQMDCNSANQSDILNENLINQQTFGQKVLTGHENVKVTPKAPEKSVKAIIKIPPFEVISSQNLGNSIAIQQLGTREHSQNGGSQKPPINLRQFEKSTSKLNNPLTRLDSKDMIASQNSILEENHSLQCKDFRIKTRLLRKSINLMQGTKSLSISEITNKNNNSVLISSSEEYPKLGEYNPNTNLNKDSELVNYSLNVVNDNRISLPLLIMHFEGLLGTCSYYNNSNEDLKDNMKMMSECLKKARYSKLALEKPEIILRPGMKRDIKLMAKDFLIIIIFPSDAIRYKNIMRFLINNKFDIDGIYYYNKHSKEAKLNPYLMNYNCILDDFRISKDHRILIFKPIDLSVHQIKANIQDDVLITNVDNIDIMSSYDDQIPQFNRHFHGVASDSCDKIRQGVYQYHDKNFSYVVNKPFAQKMCIFKGKGKSNMNQDMHLYTKLFPKLRIQPDRVRICLFGNLLLDEKYDNYSIIHIHNKYQFRNLYELALDLIHNELNHDDDKHAFDQNLDIGCRSKQNIMKMGYGDENTQTRIYQTKHEEYNQGSNYNCNKSMTNTFENVNILTPTESKKKFNRARIINKNVHIKAMSFINDCSDYQHNDDINNRIDGYQKVIELKSESDANNADNYDNKSGSYINSENIRSKCTSNLRNDKGICLHLKNYKMNGKSINNSNDIVPYEKNDSNKGITFLTGNDDIIGEGSIGIDNDKRLYIDENKEIKRDNVITINDNKRMTTSGLNSQIIMCNDFNKENIIKHKNSEPLPLTLENKKDDKMKKYIKVDFRLAYSDIEEETMKYKFLKDVEIIKKKNSQSGIRANLPDIESLKNRVIDDIINQARQKGIKKNVMGHFIVGDLFMRNLNIMKTYEKNDFYKNTKHTQNIIDIVKLRNILQVFNNNTYHNDRYDNDLSINPFDNTKNKNEDMISNEFINPINKEKNSVAKQNLHQSQIDIMKKFANNFFICYEEI